MVSDLRQDRLDHIAGLYPGVKVTRDYGELLDSDVEAVAIATPVSTHYKMAKAALERGKHILVEKPLTNNSQLAQELIDLARKSGRVLMVGHTFEYNPAVDFLRDFIASGKLGQVYYINATPRHLDFALRSGCRAD